LFSLSRLPDLRCSFSLSCLSGLSRLPCLLCLPGLRRLLAREVPAYGGGEPLGDLLWRARGGDGGGGGDGR